MWHLTPDGFGGFYAERTGFHSGPGGAGLVICGSILLISCLFPIYAMPQAFAVVLVCTILGLILGRLGKYRGLSFLRFFCIPFFSYATLCGTSSAFEILGEKAEGLILLSGYMGIPLFCMFYGLTVYSLALGSLEEGEVPGLISSFLLMIALIFKRNGIVMRITWILALLFSAWNVLLAISAGKDGKRPAPPMFPQKAGWKLSMFLLGFVPILVGNLLSPRGGFWISALILLALYGGIVIFAMGLGKQGVDASCIYFLSGPMAADLFFTALARSSLPISDGLVPDLLRMLSGTFPVAMFRKLNEKMVLSFEKMIRGTLDGGWALICRIIEKDPQPVLKNIPDFLCLVLGLILILSMIFFTGSTVSRAVRKNH